MFEFHAGKKQHVSPTFNIRDISVEYRKAVARVPAASAVMAAWFSAATESNGKSSGVVMAV
jgi:hypothetical protein